MRIAVLFAAAIVCSAWSQEVQTLRVVCDPANELKGTVLLKEAKVSSWILKDIAGGPDLDLAFNDYVDIGLRLDKSSKNPVVLRYGTDRTPGSSQERLILIPDKDLKRDNKWHIYRLDLALERWWRGSLTDLQVDCQGATINMVKVGDEPGPDYVPEDANLPVTKYELHSKHFRFVWNAEKEKQGMNPKWAHGVLRNAEECWALYMKGFGMNEPCGKDKQGRKYLINFTCTESGYWAGGDRLNIDISGLTVDPPSWVIPHEFRHRCQFFSNTGEGGGPENMYESDPNYTRECWLWFYGPYYDPKGPKTSIEYTTLLNYCIPHSRTYYIDWPFMVYLYENPENLPGIGGQFWWKVWAGGKKGEYFWDTIQRLAPKIDRKDLLGYVARRRSFAFKHRAAKETSERTELRRRPDMPDWWQVPSEMAPMQAGYNIVEIVPDGKSVTVEFKGIANKARGADWRACLIAISETGEERYSKLWNKGKMAITLKPNERTLLMTVAATPDKMLRASFDDIESPYRTAPGKTRFPYMVKVTGGHPKESSPVVVGEMHKHPNGGGLVADTASVDQSAYVGPNAAVLGRAQVKGNARILDFATIKDTAQVLDNAVVSGHALVSGNSVVSENAKVRDFATVRNAKVNGFGRALEHAVVRDNALVTDHATAKGRSETWGEGGSLISGYGVIDGDYCGGQSVKTGFQYGHMPYEGNIWIAKRKSPMPMMLADIAFGEAGESFAPDRAGSSDALLGGLWSVVPGAIKLDGKGYTILDRQLFDVPQLLVSAKVKWDGGEANQVLFSFGESESNGFSFTPNDGTGKCRLTSVKNGKQTSINGPALPVGETVLVEVSPEGIWINSKLVSEGKIDVQPDQVLPANTNSALLHGYIGRDLAGKQPGFRGLIESVRFFATNRPVAVMAMPIVKKS